MRRPSPALLLAVLALFVALGGPATAARTAKRISGGRLTDNSVTSAKIRNGTVERKDLSGRARTSLRATPNRSVTARKLATDAVTAPAIRGGAVGTDELAQGAVTSGQVADGALNARDVTSFRGQSRLDFPSLAPNQCVSLTEDLPEGTNVSDDVIAVTPPTNWLENVPVTEVLGPRDRSFTVTACNVTNTPTTDPGPVNFRYVVFDL